MSSDLQKRVVFGAIAFLIFLLPLTLGGVVFQLFVGVLAMIGTAELMRIDRKSVV